MENKIKIGFTIGDVNGIGPEVLIKCLDDHRILKLCTPIIYGSNRILSYYKKMLNNEGFNYTSCNQVENANRNAINSIQCITEETIIQPGEPTEISAKAAFKSLESATQDLMLKKIDALVTAPISKNNMQRIGFQFQGHTEYFNEKANQESVMLLMSDNFRVGLVTNHLPIKEIASAITKQTIIKKIEIIFQSLKMDFAIFDPKIAILGLNPHSGDNGFIGNEEVSEIIPAIKEAQNKKIICSGPFSADSFFGNATFQKFDVVLSMYHDQGLVGFKSISFGSGINFTAGLPFIRTSPDHGTAFDIAGKNIASPESMLQAIFAATDIHRNRNSYLESIKNPIKRTFVESERS